MLQLSCKQYHSLGFIIALSLIAASFYFEWVVGLEPCVLCLLQRWLIMLLAVLFLLGLCFSSRIFQRSIRYLLLITAVSGITVAARQAWLQYFAADDAISCGPNLSFIWQQFGWFDAWQYVLQGGGHCADIQWQLWGLSMPVWVMLAFIGFSVLAFINKTR